jgi:uncharacterized membrane protein (UPF0127 family)
MEKKKQISKFQIAVGIIFLLCVVGLRVYSFVGKSYNITLKGERLNVMVADNEDKRMKGLGDRKSLGEYDGMLFVGMEPQKIGVVMRDMLFPIDIVWFYHGEVVDFAPNAQLEPGVPENKLKVYWPRTNSDVFLELPAGWTIRHELKIGDKIGVVNK